MLKLLWLRARIYRFFHRNESVETPQICVTLQGYDNMDPKQRINREGYQFYPALSDQEVYLMNMDEWEKVDKEEEE